jgi:SAM-dependent methyltransferase
VSAREALLSVEGVLRKLGDSKALGSFYLEFGRRLEVLKLVERYCRRGSLVLDLGAQPFIASCALRRMGYEVVAFDVEPEPYVGVAESCGVKVVRCDLERDDLGVAGADCAVFSEVLEHLHYYYAPAVLAKISRALKPGGVLVLTTPNVASLFRRLRLLLGRQPVYRYHVREYTMGEVVSMVEAAGFRVVEAYYSIVNDLTFVDAEPEDYLRVSGCIDLVGLFAKRPSRLNALRLLVYPLVRLRPGLRQLIVVVGVKVGEPELEAVERWG